MNRISGRDVVFTALADRGVDLRAIHRKTKIANVITESSERRRLAEDVAARGERHWRINASYLDFFTVKDLLTFVALPGNPTTPGEDDDGLPEKPETPPKHDQRVEELMA
jgi:hypothetical protein